MTRTRQLEGFTAAVLVAALETAWKAVRTNHPDIPEAVLIIGSGTSGRAAKWGHYGSMRWQHGDNQLAEVLISGEGLKRPATDVLTTLLHEATHGLADTRGIKDTSRQGRWHNIRFATLAGELGLEAHKDDRIGWSPCTLRADTLTTYATELDTLATALRAYRHPELHDGSGTRTTSHNPVACFCSCPRRIRVARTVLDQGPILCDVCGDHFHAVDG